MPQYLHSRLDVFQDLGESQVLIEVLLIQVVLAGSFDDLYHRKYSCTCIRIYQQFIQMYLHV